jgi:hypothetical protein
MKIEKTWIERLYEFGRILLENLQNLRRWKFLGKVAQDLNVILCTSDRNRIAF